MAIGTLNNVRLFTGGTDLTGRTNKIELSGEAEEKDATTFGDVAADGTVWKVVRGGLTSGKMAASGLWESDGVGAVDDALWAQLGGVGPWTVCPVAANTAGDLCYMANMDTGSYKLLGAPGDIAPWEAEASTAGPIARGVLLNPPGTARTATGTGTIVDFGTTWPAGKTMYASLHVLSVSGTSTPTATFRVESASVVGFGSPTTRITFAAATARGAQMLSVAGPITDQFVRAAWTITGTTPSFLAVVTVGIANS